MSHADLQLQHKRRVLGKLTQCYQVRRTLKDCASCTVGIVWNYAGLLLFLPQNFKTISQMASIHAWSSLLRVVFTEQSFTCLASSAFVLDYCFLCFSFFHWSGCLHAALGAWQVLAWVKAAVLGLSQFNIVNFSFLCVMY